MFTLHSSRGLFFQIFVGGLRGLTSERLTSGTSHWFIVFRVCARLYLFLDNNLPPPPN